MPPRFETPQDSDSSSEKIIDSKPRLRGIFQSLKLLESEQFELSDVSWKELWQGVKPFENGLEFSDNVREVIRMWVSKKVPALKESVSRLEDLPEDALVDALGQNWFEALDDEEKGFEVSGQRREVLLTVMAGVVSRIETYTVKNIIEHASQKDLEKLGLTEDLRGLTLDVLDASIKTNPLFARFRAFSLLTPKPPEEATGVKMFVPGDTGPHTIAELFPHETQFIARRFTDVLEKGGAWQEKNPDAAEVHLKNLERLYLDALASGFPILVNSGRFGMYKEPYLDPELKISLATPDAKHELDEFRRAQAAMAESLSEFNLDEFHDPLARRPVASATVVGGYGVNLILNAVAQERPAILLYYDKEVQAYDRRFPMLMSLAENTDSVFADLSEEERRTQIEKMSRMLTMLHEYGHDIFPHKTDESILTPAYERFGGHSATSIDEVKAETMYRAFVPAILERGGLEGTKEQWAVAMVISSLNVASEQPVGDEYYYGAIYTLNRLFEEGVVTFSGGKIHIHDFERLYAINKENAQSLVALHTDETIDEQKTRVWIRKNCRALPIVSEAAQFVKEFAKTI
ncbi:MAG: hypothetical protein UY14_C0011G0014 [Parcubacteria group bacterium GW2011_GWA1_47_9]|nr:MAG: hypothetical protein UY14_C0011G0014 [Parcubacteria group bacterium GW2011_GWA1_47_9]